MDELPSDVILYEVLLDLPYETVVSYCSTNKRAKQICQDYYFWVSKGYKDLHVPIFLFSDSMRNDGIKDYINTEKLLRTQPGEIIKTLLNNEYYDEVKLIISEKSTHLSDHSINEVISTAYKIGIIAFEVIDDITKYASDIIDYYYFRVLEDKNEELHIYLRDYIGDPFFDGAMHWAAISNDLSTMRYMSSLAEYEEYSAGGSIEVGSALRYSNDEIVEYYNKLYPNIFTNRTWMRAVAEEIMKDGSIDKFNRLLRYVDGNINFFRLRLFAKRHARQFLPYIPKIEDDI